MLHKNKLKGIFIDNDLSWEERKIQEEMNRWAKVQRGKREEIKIGLGRIKVKEVWRYWKEIKQKEEKRKKDDKGGIEETAIVVVREQNFA